MPFQVVLIRTVTGIITRLHRKESPISKPELKRKWAPARFSFAATPYHSAVRLLPRREQPHFLRLAALQIPPVPSLPMVCRTARPANVDSIWDETVNRPLVQGARDPGERQGLDPRSERAHRLQVAVAAEAEVQSEHVHLAWVNFDDRCSRQRRKIICVPRLKGPLRLPRAALDHSELRHKLRLIAGIVVCWFHCHRSIFFRLWNRSPPKEEDDMRAAEVLQGLKGRGAPSD